MTELRLFIPENTIIAALSTKNQGVNLCPMFFNTVYASNAAIEPIATTTKPSKGLPNRSVIYIKGNPNKAVTTLAERPLSLMFFKKKIIEVVAFRNGAVSFDKFLLPHLPQRGQNQAKV